MKVIYCLFQFLVFCNYLFIHAQPKYFANSVQWNDYFTQEFRKAIPTGNNYTILVGNIYPTFPGHWQNGVSYMDKYGNCTPAITYTNPFAGDLGNFDSCLKNDLLLIVGQLSPVWDTTTYQAYCQWINTNNDLTELIPLVNYPSAIRAIYPCADGGYLLVGRVIPNYPNTPQWLEMYAVKLNDQFDIEWERIYNDLGYYYDNYLTDILPAPDGNGYYLLGTIKWGGSMFESGDILLMKINNAGEPVEQYPFSISGMDQTLSFCITPQNNLLISGAIEGETYNVHGIVLKTDLQGNIIWQNELFQSPKEGEIASLIVSSDGNYVGGGSYKTAPGQIDAYLVKLNASTGAILWQRHYGGNYRDYCYDMIATPDGGYLMVGRQDTLTGAFAYIVKTNCMGLLTEPQAAFTFSTDSTTLAATFYNQSQYVYPDSIDGGHFIWQFDDGTPPYQTKNPEPITHLYAQPGTYYVTLQAIVCNDTG
ncbi:hypothetical protein C7N43_27555, partial [Sphingobacteriales bacterium UPWRP_1]